MSKPDNHGKRPGERVFLGSMWIVSDFGPLQKRYDSFLATGKPRFAHLLDGLLLYDRVVLPTQDFMVLTALIDVLGERSVLDLLNHDELRFVRLKGSFAYGGNGAGIISFRIGRRDTMEPSLPVFMETPQALDVALGVLKHKVASAKLRDMVLENTTCIDANDLTELAAQETYKDIMASPHLNRLFPAGSDLIALPGIAPNAIRAYSYLPAENNKGDLIDQLLLLSTANLELKLAEVAECADATTLAPVGHLIHGKIERALRHEVPLKQWCQIKEMDDQPDGNAYVLDRPGAERPDALSALMKVRRTKHGIEFRRWFHEHCRGDTTQAAKAYADLLKQVPSIDRCPAKVVRFIVTAAAGLLGPLGSAIGAADTFFVSKVLAGASPKHFLNDLRQVHGK